MNKEILSKLRVITAEEQAILDGRTTIDRDLYMQGEDNTINSRKLLDAGKLITIRPHTRFIHFPPHRHNYVEVVYMCCGETTHLVNGQEIVLRQGDLLFLSQSVIHEVCKARESDIAVNFIILPDYFVSSLAELQEEQTPLRQFLVDCLFGERASSGFLHFQVSQVPVVQNLVEVLLWTILQETPNRRKFSQMTMTLLLLQLMAHTETLVSPSREETVMWRVLRYVETNYSGGSLTELAELLHYDVYWLSRQIKRISGKTYTELVQEKRLAQAAFLLKNTTRSVSDVAGAVGYENMGYFHRIFRDAFGVNPGQYRAQKCK